MVTLWWELWWEGVAGKAALAQHLCDTSVHGKQGAFEQRMEIRQPGMVRAQLANSIVGFGEVHTISNIMDSGFSTMLSSAQ